LTIPVPREHRRGKTDRLDTEMLMRAALGWLRGEARHRWMVRILTLEQEDIKRPNRERDNLVREQTRLVNRMKTMLALLGITGFSFKSRDGGTF
jgi:transposase